MKSYFIHFLMLFAVQHGVVSELTEKRQQQECQGDHSGATGANKLCVVRGKSEKLFANATLAIHKERMALYANGADTYKLIAIWRVTNSSTVLEKNSYNIDINMDKNRNIWINDVSEDDQGNYSIRYIFDNSKGPEVELFVLAPESASSRTTMAIGSISSTLSTYSSQKADKDGSPGKPLLKVGQKKVGQQRWNCCANMNDTDKCYTQPLLNRGEKRISGFGTFNHSWDTVPWGHV